MRQIPRFALLCFGALTLLVSSNALSQEGVSGGVKVGSILFHPGVFVKTLYDTNFFLESPDEATDGYSHVVTLKPGVRFRSEVANPENHSWASEVKAAWGFHFMDDVASKHDGFDTSILLNAELNRKSTFKVLPSVSLKRMVGPVDDYQQRSTDYVFFSPGAEVAIEPHGGVVFSERLGYRFLYKYFEGIEDINSFQNKFTSVTRWNFLPKTAVVLSLDQRFIGYEESERSTVEGSSTSYTLKNVDSMPFRASLGVKGLLSDRVGFGVLGGYAYPFYGDDSDQHLFTILGDLSYRWGESFRVGVSYNKNFEDSTYGNYYTFHGVKAYLNASVLRGLSAHLRGGAKLLAMDAVDGVESRDDTRYEFEGGLKFDYIQNLPITFTYFLRGNSSDFQVPVSVEGEGSFQTEASYLKHVIQLNVEYEY